MRTVISHSEVFALSAQMTGSFNKSPCGSTLKQQVAKQDVEKSRLGPLLTVHLFFWSGNTVWAQSITERKKLS